MRDLKRNGLGWIRIMVTLMVLGYALRGLADKSVMGIQVVRMATVGTAVELGGLYLGERYDVVRVTGFATTNDFLGGRTFRWEANSMAATNPWTVFKVSGVETGRWVAADAKAFGIDGYAGLTAHFHAGQLPLPAGGALSFAGGEVKVADNSTNQIVIDLFQGKVHAFPRAIHDGGVCIGTLVARNGMIERFEPVFPFRVPSSAVERTKAMLRSGKGPVRIGLMGDSLLHASGIGISWHRLLFDAQYATNGLNVVNASLSTVGDHAVGGQTARHTLAMLGPAVEGTGEWMPGEAMTLKPEFLVNEESSPYPMEWGGSSLLKDFDLVIVGSIFNSGNNKLEFMESIVKRLRRAGVEVIVVTESSGPSTPLYLYDEGFGLKAVCEAHGAALCDTWCYMDEAVRQGQTPYITNNVHYVQAGYDLFASALRSVLCDFELADRLAGQTNWVPSTTLYTNGINCSEVSFSPVITTGKANQQSRFASAYNPAVVLNAKLHSQSVTVLASNEYAVFSHAHAREVDVLIEDDVGVAVVQLLGSEGDIPVRTIKTTGWGTYINLYECAKADTLAKMTNYANGNGLSQGLANLSVKIQCAQGTTRVVGVVFHTFLNRQVRETDLQLTGTWFAEPSGGVFQPEGVWTDAPGDTLQMAFEGTGCQLLLHGGVAAGLVEVQVDGEIVHSSLNLRDPNPAGTQYVLSVFEDAGGKPLAFGMHDVKVTLLGASDSAEEPGPGQHRLAWRTGYVFDQR